MSTDAEWEMLARRLPGDRESVARTLQSYRDGTNPDLQRWRALGGFVHVPAPAKRYPKRSPQPLHASTANALAARNGRICAAFWSGVPQELIAERFGISPSAISRILGEQSARSRR